jgi:hypothetical protein
MILVLHNLWHKILSALIYSNAGSIYFNFSFIWYIMVVHEPPWFCQSQHRTSMPFISNIEELKVFLFPLLLSWHGLLWQPRVKNNLPWKGCVSSKSLFSSPRFSFLVMDDLRSYLKFSLWYYVLFTGCTPKNIEMCFTDLDMMVS